MRSLLRQELLRLGPATCFVAALSIVAILWGGLRTGLSPWWPLEVLSATLSLLLLATLLRLATDRPPAGRIAFACLLLPFVPLAAFRIRVGQPVGFDLLRYTYDYLLRSDVLRWAVLDSGAEVLLVLVGGILGVVLLSAWRWGRVLPAPEKPARRALMATALYLPFLLLPGIGGDDLTGLARGAVRYYLWSGPYAAVEAGAPYPYVHGTPGEPARRRSEDEPPNVFIVLLESLNARYIETATEGGEPYTPFFNSLIGRGVYVEHFYGNSVQTIRGQLSTLCGILDSIRNRVAVEYPDTRLHCLPEILRSLGYSTCFFEGYHDLTFDNTGSFMKRIGFDQVQAMTGDFITPEDAPYVWGWGIQDDVFYRKVFASLDRLRSASPPDRERPLFVTLQSTTNHLWFDKVPEEKRSLYETPRSLRQHYANSVHLADSYLDEFFRQLEARPHLRGSLVVLTGDHSFPTDDHDGHRYFTSGFSEDVSRTPLLILWPGRLAPRRIDRPAHSQIDIAPTLLDLLQIEAPHHFMGRSVLASGDEAPQTVFTIQPLGGVSILEVLYPMKYVMNLESGREHLFNVETDPRQTRDLIQDLKDSPILLRFRGDLRTVFLNQDLIERDRIWPR